jgi:hypothetical protein
MTSDCDQVLRLGIEEGWEDVVEAVLDNGISPNHAFSIQRPGSSDWTSVQCIQLAALLAHASIVELLLRRNATVNVTDVDGYTVLMDTARSGSPECARLLLGAGAKLEVIGPHGSAARMAVMHSNAPVLSVLLDAGARIGDKNSCGQDCVLEAWTMAYGAAGKGKTSPAGETFEVFHTLFGRLANSGRGGTVDAYCYVCLGATIEGPWYKGMRTCICWNSTCPAWKQHFQLINPMQDAGMSISSMFVKIEVWDWDQVGDEMLLGSVIQSLAAVYVEPNATLASVFNLVQTLRPNASNSPTSPRRPNQSNSPTLTTELTLLKSADTANLLARQKKATRQNNCGSLITTLKLQPDSLIVDIDSALSLVKQVGVFCLNLLVYTYTRTHFAFLRCTLTSGPGYQGGWRLPESRGAGGMV